MRPVVHLTTMALLTTATLLGRCDDDRAARQRAVEAIEHDVELFRLTDPAHGADELRRRILQNLKLSDPYIAIWVDGMDARAIPASTPWVIRCDTINGLAIAFTSNQPDEAGGLGIRLSEVRLNKAQCLDVAMATAKVLDAILAGR